LNETTQHVDYLTTKQTATLKGFKPALYYSEKLAFFLKNHLIQALSK